MIGLRCGGTVACCMMAAYAIGRTSRSSVDNQTREEEGDTRALGEEVNKLRRELEEMRLKREADRSGRIRAERALREQTLGNKNASSGAAAADSDNSPDGQGDQESVKYCNVKPIGWLRSCYRRRFGTPRQGTVVHGGRASLKLTPECNPLMSTANLSEYSHVWLIYIFHENTNLGTKSQVKSKVRPPRLGGEKVGLFSTRTPHRPNPIGLSLVRLHKVEKGVLHFSGLDLIDGTPILDVKPYLPNSDSIPAEHVSVPAWFSAPVISSHEAVNFSPTAVEQLRDLVDELEFYDDFETVYSTLNEVLSNDIRSLHMRDSDSVTTNEKPNIHFDNLKVFFQVNEENTVQVTSIELGRVSKTGSTLDDSRVSSPADCVSRLDVDVRRPLD